jgi:Ferritin-like domain
LNSAPVVPPCNYTFPATNFEEFLAVANLLTSTNFGSVIGVQEQLSGGDLALAASTTSILGVETRHDAFLRILHGDVPNPSPFDTGIPIGWAYNIGLQLTVPGSCPIEVPLPTYPQLSLDGANPWAFASDSYPETISFKWDRQQAWVQRESGKQLYAAWVNLFNQPIYTTVTVDQAGNGITSVPKDMQAVAFVALTTLRPSNFNDLQDATLVGPLAIAIS